MIEKKCKKCGVIFKSYKHKHRMFCSKKCSSLARIGVPHPMSEEQKKLLSKIRIEKGLAKGSKNPRWGKSKYKNIEEKKQAKLESGRKSYRKHIKTRLFYYRQLAYKRRTAIGNHTLQEWENLKKKFNYCCVGCGMQEPFIGQYYEKLTEDHITPISKNGSNFIDNIQPMCWNCNSRKSNRFVGLPPRK